MEDSRRRRAVEILLIALFLVIVLLPFAGKLLPSEGAFALTENRRPAPFPTIELGRPGWGYSIVSFPRRFERYWNDSFAFRWYLIRAHSLAKLALGVSPSPKALVGQDGYLFYAAEQSVDYFRGTKPFTPAELARWRDDLESRRQWLAQRGIRYLLVVAPNKETIYGEFMPTSLRKVRPDSRLDELLADLAGHSNIDVVDLRGALTAAKPRQRVYHKTDTHWNDAGAMIAAREILARIKLWYPATDDGAFTGRLAEKDAPGGDLARILALEDRFPEHRYDWVPGAGQAARVASAPSGFGRDIAVMECVACDGPKVVMNHDSFADALAPFLAERFRRTVLVEGTRLEHGLIERERPDVVIQEVVERALMCPDLRGC
jgi:alginate O-acetyltransferase complex protein AlgJ